MIEHVEQGRRVLVWPSAFSPDEIAVLVRRTSCLAPNVYVLDDGGLLSRGIGAEIAPRMVGAPAFRWADAIVRVSQTTPLPWHFDRDYGAPWRVLVYLSSHGGTEFRSGLIAGGGLGDIVMFDTALEHRSQPFITHARSPKTILGLRALYAEAP